MLILYLQLRTIDEELKSTLSQQEVAEEETVVHNPVEENIPAGTQQAEMPSAAVHNPVEEILSAGTQQAELPSAAAPSTSPAAAATLTSAPTKATSAVPGPQDPIASAPVGSSEYMESLFSAAAEAGGRPVSTGESSGSHAGISGSGGDAPSSGGASNRGGGASARRGRSTNRGTRAAASTGARRGRAAAATTSRGGVHGPGGGGSGDDAATTTTGDASSGSNDNVRSTDTSTRGGARVASGTSSGDVRSGCGARAFSGSSSGGDGSGRGAIGRGVGEVLRGGLVPNANAYGMPGPTWGHGDGYGMPGPGHGRGRGLPWSSPYHADGRPDAEPGHAQLYGDTRDLGKSGASYYGNHGMNVTTYGGVVYVAAGNMSPTAAEGEKEARRQKKTRSG